MLNVSKLKIHLTFKNLSLYKSEKWMKTQEFVWCLPKLHKTHLQFFFSVCFGCRGSLQVSFIWLFHFSSQFCFQKEKEGTRKWCGRGFEKKIQYIQGWQDWIHHFYKNHNKKNYKKLTKIFYSGFFFFLTSCLQVASLRKRVLQVFEG